MDEHYEVTVLDERLLGEKYEEPIMEFSEDQFLEELERGSEAMEAEYSEEITKTILAAYGSNFSDGVVQLHASTTKGEALIYRNYPPVGVDTIDIAIKAGLLEPNHPSLNFIKSWINLYPEAYEMPDFTCDTGLARIFVFFGVNTQGGMRPLEEILGAPGVPAYLRAKQDFLIENGLAIVQATLVDLRNAYTYIYFVAQGPLTREQAAHFTALAGAGPPSEFEFLEMATMLGTGNFFLCTEIDNTGRITRVDFYILFPIELPGGRMPELPERLHQFWDIDTWADEEMDVLGWSFGRNVEAQCIQAERTYGGNLRGLWRTWGIMSVA